MSPPRIASISIGKAATALLPVACAVAGLATPARAMTVTGYTGASHDRFSSGFPAAPLPNTATSFTGFGRDWSGTGWDSSNPTKGFGFLSPSHYLVARHYAGASTVRVFDGPGVLRSGTEWKIEETTYGVVFSGQIVGDLSLGTLTAGLPGIARYGVLDLNNSSSANTPANYINTAMLIYGRGPDGTSSPRIAATPIDDFWVSGLNHYFTTPRTELQLESGDSGSPAFAAWTNPNGTPEPAILGNHAAISATQNAHNFLGTFEVMNKLNSLMVDDGRALRVVGNPFYTWVGNPSAAIDNPRAWGLNGNQTTADQFVLFDASSTSNRSATVGTEHNLRGISFKGTTASGDAFSITGSTSLTVGRGGITNYDNDRQSITANLTLGDHQFWDAGSGGLTTGDINTNGKLLEIRSGGTTTIAGAITGGGGIALDSGTLVLSGNSSFTGTAWVHDGTLQANGAMAHAASVRLSPTAILAGSGKVTSIQGSGTVSPGAGAAILTAPGLTTSNGLDFAFRFTAATAPFFNTPAASSNDLLRLTAASPFATALSPSNRVSIFLDVPALTAGQRFRGGFFTDQSADFLASISGADFDVFLADTAGTISHEGKNYRAYTGPLVLSLTTEPQSATFADGTANGRILQLEIQPDPTSYDGWAWNAFPRDTPAADKLPNADPNNDGITNLLACALNIDPLDTPRDKLPAHSIEPGESGSTMVFRFRKNKITAGLLYEVQTSGDLTSWPAYPTPPAVVNPDPDGDGRTELLEVRIPLAAEDTAKFVRLRVRQN